MKSVERAEEITTKKNHVCGTEVIPVISHLAGCWIEWIRVSMSI
jgi:hypothetical protein